jgi:hypothetical protein
LLLALGVPGVLAPAAGALPGRAPFVNKLSAPAMPPLIQFGSDLHWEPAPLLGDFEGDAEFWDLFYTAAEGISREAPTVPVDGWLSGVYVKGRAVSGDMPGPGGSQPFRVGVEQPLPDGRLQVLSTSNPPFQLPGTNGTYYYWIGPPYTGFQMPLKPGEYVSFDTRGGTFAVFGSAPGSSSASTVGKGQEQNAGVIWTGTPHPGVELLMRMVEQPKVSTAKLEAAVPLIGKALTLEQEAEPARPKAAKQKVKSSIGELRAAAALVHQAGEPKEGELSHDSEVSIEHYLSEALAEDKAALTAKNTHARSGRIRTAMGAKRSALGDIAKAKSLARQVP